MINGIKIKSPRVARLLLGWGFTMKHEGRRWSNLEDTIARENEIFLIPPGNITNEQSRLIVKKAIKKAMDGGGQNQYLPRQ